MKIIATLTIVALIVVMTKARRRLKGWSQSRDENVDSMSSETATTMSYDSFDDLSTTYSSSSSWSKSGNNRHRKRNKKQKNGGRKRGKYDDSSSEGFWSTSQPFSTTDSYDDIPSTTVDDISTTADDISTTVDGISTTVDDISSTITDISTTNNLTSTTSEARPVAVAVDVVVGSVAQSANDEDDEDNTDSDGAEGNANSDGGNANSDESIDINDIDESNSAGMKVAGDNRVERHGVVFSTNGGSTMEWIAVITGVIAGVTLIACLIMGTLICVKSSKFDTYDNVAADDNEEDEGVEFGAGKARIVIPCGNSGDEEDGDALLTR